MLCGADQTKFIIASLSLTSQKQAWLNKICSSEQKPTNLTTDRRHPKHPDIEKN
jgi:hypothetical protein